MFFCSTRVRRNRPRPTAHRAARSIWANLPSSRSVRSRPRCNRCWSLTNSSVAALLRAAGRGSSTKPCPSTGTKSSPARPSKQLQQLLPKKTVNEYIRDGKPSTADDDPLRVVGYDENGKPLPPGDISKAAKKLYQRRLRDYAAEFDGLARRRIAMLTDIDALNKDIARLKQAEEAAKKIQAFRENERTKLTSDLAGIDKERAAIKKHLADVNKLLARARELTAELLRRNNQLAAELAARQLRAAKPAG